MGALASRSSTSSRPKRDTGRSSRRRNTSASGSLASGLVSASAQGNASSWPVPPNTASR